MNKKALIVLGIGFGLLIWLNNSKNLLFGIVGSIIIVLCTIFLLIYVMLNRKKAIGKY